MPQQVKVIQIVDMYEMVECPICHLFYVEREISCPRCRIINDQEVNKDAS
jgi:phage FluMu protein Com